MKAFEKGKADLFTLERVCVNPVLFDGRVHAIAHALVFKSSKKLILNL